MFGCFFFPSIEVKQIQGFASSDQLHREAISSQHEGEAGYFLVLWIIPFTVVSGVNNHGDRFRPLRIGQHFPYKWPSMPSHGLGSRGFKSLDQRSPLLTGGVLVYGSIAMGSMAF